MLDYGYRSKCCNAPIRLGRKKIKKTSEQIKIWICCKCGSRDTDIIPKGTVLDQHPRFPLFSDREV
jgi:hypothetical protein